MKKQISFILTLALMLQVFIPAMPVYAALYSTITCSAGSTVALPGAASGKVIDENIVLTTGANLDGARVYITDGFNASTDQLIFNNTPTISGIYTAGTGVLTLSGNATPEEYQEALRSVEIKVSGAALGTREVVFSLGEKLKFGSNYYEYIDNVVDITWTDAKAAAAARLYYGRNGYLTTITSQAENDFITEKLSKDAWIGCSDATTEGSWYWDTNPTESGILISTGKRPGAVTTYAGVYSNWASTQPDDFENAEDYGQIYCGNDEGRIPGTWNDLPDSGNIRGYIVEYDSIPIGITSTKTVVIDGVSLNYAGNTNNSGTVPSSTGLIQSGDVITVAANTGNLIKTGKGFAGWNTAADGSGTTYYPGETLAVNANTTLYAIWANDPTIQCSAGAGDFTVGSASTIVVDSGLTVAAGAMISGAKAYITTGYDSVNDRLSFTPTSNISGSFDISKGTLTLSGNASFSEYQTALRSVTFKTSSSAIGTRNVEFSLGNKVAFGGHSYEYVATGGISWTDAKTAAQARTYYGQTGYLATITSQAENDFLKDKLGADAWIGASDDIAQGATTEGAWQWVTGPEGAANILISTGNSPNVTTIAGVYSNWNSGEPNNSDPGENYAEIYCTGANSGKWNDLNNDPISGYLVEYNPAAGSSASKTVNVVTTPAIVVPSGGGGGSSSNAGSGVNVIVNGQTQSAGTQKETLVNGVKTSEIDVNEDTVSKKIDAVLAAKDKNQPNVIEVPVITNANNIKVGLTGDIISKMDDNDFTLNVSHKDVKYLIPAEEIKIKEIAAKLGAEKSLTDIEVKIQFTAPDEKVIQKINETVKAKEYEIVIPPMSFEVKAVNLKNNQEVTISKFVNYVERMFEIPKGVDASKITTGIVLNDDGTFSHVPTSIVLVDGKYYAKINSLTNSTYTVIWNPVTFKDMENHWAKTSANNMGSRLVVSGVGNGNFEPDRAITRGEFAAIISKALGIYRNGTGQNKYKDVTSENIFFDAISIADDYGLIKGYGSSTYNPNKNITREEAMAILTRASEIAKLENTSQSKIDDFSDSEAVSLWAKNSVDENIKKGIIIGNNGMIRPKDSISRAEVVVAVERILKKTELINSENK